MLLSLASCDCNIYLVFWCNEVSLFLYQVLKELSRLVLVSIKLGQNQWKPQYKKLKDNKNPQKNDLSLYI